MTVSKLVAVALMAMATLSPAHAKPLTSSQAVTGPAARPFQGTSGRLARQTGHPGATLNGTTIRPRSAPPVINGTTVRRRRS
jgi:hypothetical protein